MTTASPFHLDGGEPFSYRDGVLQVGGLHVDLLARAAGTPLYLLVSLSDFRSRTHPESGTAVATRCHSLLLAGQAILGADLHEWLFLLVTA